MLHVVCGAVWRCVGCGLRVYSRLSDYVPVVVDCGVAVLLLRGVRWLLYIIYGIDWYYSYCILQIDPRLFDCIPVVVDCVVAGA